MKNQNEATARNANVIDEMIGGVVPVSRKSAAKPVRTISSASKAATYTAYASNSRLRNKTYIKTWYKPTAMSTPKNAPRNRAS